MKRKSTRTSPYSTTQKPRPGVRRRQDEVLIEQTFNVTNAADGGTESGIVLPHRETHLWDGDDTVVYIDTEEPEEAIAGVLWVKPLADETPTVTRNITYHTTESVLEYTDYTWYDAALAVWEHYVFIVNHAQGTYEGAPTANSSLTVLDIETPGSPVVVYQEELDYALQSVGIGAYGSQLWVTGIDYDGTVVLFGDGVGGDLARYILAFDISDPENPVLSSAAGTQMINSWEIFVLNDEPFLVGVGWSGAADDFDELIVTDGGSLEVIGTLAGAYANPANTPPIVVDDHVLVPRVTGLQCVSLADPSAPFQEWLDTATEMAVAAKDAFAYANSDVPVQYVYDLTDPTVIDKAVSGGDTLPTNDTYGYSVKGYKQFGDDVYVLNHVGYVYDMSDEANPSEADTATAGESDTVNRGGRGADISNEADVVYLAALEMPLETDAWLKVAIYTN